MILPFADAAEWVFRVLAPFHDFGWPNGWRLSGERMRVRCSRGLGGAQC